MQSSPRFSRTTARVIPTIRSSFSRASPALLNVDFDVTGKRLNLIQIMLKYKEIVDLLYFFEAAELIGDVHHAISIIGDEFSSQANASPLRQIQKMIDHDGTYSPGHHTT